MQIHRRQTISINIYLCYNIYRMYSYAATRFHKDICIRYSFYLQYNLHFMTYVNRMHNTYRR